MLTSKYCVLPPSRRVLKVKEGPFFVPMIRINPVQKLRAKPFPATDARIELPENGLSSSIEGSNIADVQSYFPSQLNSSVQAMTLPEISRTVSDISNQSSRAETSESIAAFQIVLDDHVMPGTVTR
ncbi:hypothetical protein KL933_001392 [Ogataea haglerorum]|uniref:Uncharacterized protein n=1 Tax=Ogataea haglerorum TaxID=1937702 RepID=A0AAN6I273_9ASCO|nr:uncharacterized protein KL911_002048 [Ogataea haglerorum]KAG7696899.1 hypothetical protein KL915_002162 [Ogataea haglerorum]KAG7709607.1 hypothetical protein KL950_001826 [Ogataea haglerorum]KAG7729166.1 hypothetical protein KL933_001392 [Ogataea haglerorum]KAG7732254.1 hypothetical protein KL948_002452 [Ogataea haglerorum]KAG7738734.1 hypothetical protein KL932_003627 [Ogataea haglerorum]